MEKQSITKEYLRIAGNLYGTVLKAYLALFMLAGLFAISGFMLQTIGELWYLYHFPVSPFNLFLVNNLFIPIIDIIVATQAITILFGFLWGFPKRKMK
jgi:hypothetical protein